jgi:hypothetical protein
VEGRVALYLQKGWGLGYPEKTMAWWVRQAFHCCDKYLREPLERRKDLFWLAVSEVSVHGQLAVGKLNIMVEAAHELSSYLMAPQRQREAGKAWDEAFLHSHMPSDLPLLAKPHLLLSITLLWCHQIMNPLMN